MSFPCNFCNARAKYYTESTKRISKATHSFFKNVFFPSTFSEWNKLDPSLGNSESLSTFKERLFHSSGQLPILCIIAFMLKELDLLRYFDLVWTTWENTSSNNFEDSILTLYATVGVVLNPQLIQWCPLYNNEKWSPQRIHDTDSVLTQILLFGNTSFTSSKTERF